MSPHSPASQAVAADLASARYHIGVLRGHWRQVAYDFPFLIIAVAAIEPKGDQSEYCFRFELSGFPGAAPEVKIWDCTANTTLAPDRRPKGSPRVTEAFKLWGTDTIYRPWDRQGGLHNRWAITHPDLAWHPQRDLTFILEDIHGLLTANALAGRNRPAA
jgi:hypothetical protein